MLIARSQFICLSLTELMPFSYSGLSKYLGYSLMIENFFPESNSSIFWSPGWRWAFNGMIRKLLTGHGRGIPWPIGRSCDCGRNVDFHIDDLNNFNGTALFQTVGNARIRVGRGVWIARGCSLITANHDLADPDVHAEPQNIDLGDHCWLGANVVITPGVVLGPHTVVGANAVVTKGFPEGHCVLGGVPAKVIKRLDNTLEKEADR